ncbi:MAG: serine/threonine protein phosphatase [Anaerolineae bacterium]|nr:serine/threonine protein phosphatase [Anaerolineae bacterium]
MITFDRQLTLWSSPQTYPALHSYDLRRRLAHHRLNTAFQAAPIVLFDDTTRLVFFSDCHRGDNSRLDAFSPNEALFLHALHHYYQEGFTYIEVGDGDELWKNPGFHAIRVAHGQVFEWLHRFEMQQRLYLLFGNHDVSGSMHREVHKDDLVAREGLILQHCQTGQQIFVTHGHQADIASDTLYRVSRMTVRRIWRQLQVWKLVPVASPHPEEHAPHPFERFLMSWAAINQMVLICGHTHRMAGAVYGETPYFNTGHCVTPGVITGLEIQHGEIGLVRWRATPGDASPGQREVLSAPRKLKYFN